MRTITRRELAAYAGALLGVAATGSRVAAYENGAPQDYAPGEIVEATITGHDGIRLIAAPLAARAA